MSVNIINQYINFSKKCIKNYLKIIMEKKYDQDIVDELLKTYVETRYHNIYPWERTSFLSNITHQLSKKMNVLTYDEQYEDKQNIKNTFLLFGYLLIFDNAISCESAKDVIKKLNKFRIDKFGIVEEDFEKNMFEIVKSDLVRKKQYINNFNNKNFETIYNKTNINNVYNTNIEHKLKFPKIYSKYAIDKVFSSKDINEHKLFIVYPIVAAKVLSNIVEGQFKKEYLIDYNSTLNNKEKKLKRLYSLIDDDIAKEKIIMKISLKDFLKDKSFFINNMKLGFNYAVIIDNEANITSENIDILKFFKYIIIKPTHEKAKDLIKLDNVVIDR